MTFKCIFETYLVPLIPIATALLVFFLGIYAYFRQKEYELITDRYLKEGIDAISNNVDKSLALFRHNWWQSTVVLKHYRDLGKDMRPELYRDAFIEPDPSLLEVWRDHRLVDIVGNDIFNRAHQSLDAFIRSSYSFFQDDLCAMVRVTVEGGKEIEVTASSKDIIDVYFEEIKSLDEKSRRYYVLLSQLQKISSLIQTERFSFKNLKNLKNRKEIQESINILNEQFKDTTDDETNNG